MYIPGDHPGPHLLGLAAARALLRAAEVVVIVIVTVIREFRDVVFEDVVFDNNGFVTIYCGKSYGFVW